MKKVLKEYILLGIISIIAILLITPIFRNLNYGLDLQGGFEVLYSVSTIDKTELTNDMVISTEKTIEKRVNTLGVSEPNITVEGNNIRVQLAGVTSSENARILLSKTASLTFRDLDNNLLMDSSVLNAAKESVDEKGMPAVSLSIKDKDKFYEVTKLVSEKEAGKNMIVIWLDYEDKYSLTTRELNNTIIYGYEDENGKFQRCGSDTSRCLSAASVRQAFASDVIIEGSFTNEEVKTLTNLINSGSLQTKLTEISSKTVDAEFGIDALEKTLLAGVIGIFLIMFVLINLYHICGLVSSISVLVYMALTLFIFWLVGGVLTLPGIAALVIGIGMAVDSSVISFSKIKDELYEGKSLENAYKNGIKTSFGTILDANLTTLIVAIILFIFGESSVKGFATMLIISILVTMLIMVGLNRLLLNRLVKTGYFKDKQNLFIRINTKDIPNVNKNEKRTKFFFKKLDFVKQKNKVFIILGLLVIIGSLSLVFNKLNLGIDFKGGSSITIKSDMEINEETIKNDIEELGYKFYNYSKTQDGSYIVRIEDTLDENSVTTTSNILKEKYEASIDIGVVSNIVKKELVKNAIISLLLAFLGIIIYVSIRYTFSYAISGLVALLHDVFVIFMIFSLFKIEVSTIFIAAILSIVGYSINDTIVTFDRIRETIKFKFNSDIKNDEQLRLAINVSLRETLSRTIITTITTVIPVISLIIFGSHEILNFNIALLIGLIAGTLSSILLSTSLWYVLEKKHIGKPKKKWLDDEVEELKIKGINS